MYSFEGEFRRRPQQSLGGASRKVARDELLHKAQTERHQREEKRKIIQSATTIQAFLRGSLVRLVEKRKLRFEFDEIVKSCGSNLSFDVLQNLVGKFLHFYDEVNDTSRLTYICQAFLKDAENIIEFCYYKPNEWLYKFQKLLWINVEYLKKCVTPNTNISLSLRFVEVFTTFETYNNIYQRCAIPSNRRGIGDSNICSPQKILGKIWDYLIKRSYFAVLRLVLDNRVPDSLITSTQPPTPLASSLLDLFSRPLLSDNARKPYFLRFLLQDVFTEDLSPQITCFLLPCLSCQPNVITVDALLTAIHPDNIGFNFHTTSSLLYAFIYLFSRQAVSLSKQQSAEYLICLQFLLQSVPLWKESVVDDNSSDDGEVIMDTDESKLQIHEEIINMVNDIDHVNMIVGLLENEKLFSKCVISICSLCHLLLEHNKLAILNYRLLYTLAFKPVFFRMLWRSIVSSTIPSTFGTATPLLQIINMGMSFSANEQDSFIPQLIVFCALLNHLLSTLHYFEFYDENDDDSGNVVKTMPFTLNELASICATLKDVCMGLIELAYPDKKSAFSRDYVKAITCTGSKVQINSVCEIRLWNRLFKVVVTLLRQLYSRDCRRKFCPDGTWIAKQFPIFFERAAELYFTTKRGCGYAPFVGLQNLTREQLEEEGPPPSALEARQLAILREFPFAIRFHDRFRIFQSLIVKDKHDNQGELINFQMGPQIRITVRRNFIYEDAFTSLSFQSEPNIKMRILVQLVNAVGLDEVGIDGGGIFREFLHELLKTCFDPNRGFFKTTHDCLLYPNPNVERVMPDFARHYFFIGRMLGKAIYENMLVELPLAAFFLAKILSRKTSDVDIHHLASLDPVMYRNLLYLKTYDGDVSDLGLDFTVMNSEFGENEVVELKPGGANIPVTESNRITYIHLMADYKLNRQIKAQCQAFKEGLANVIDMEWLYMFDPNELQVLISGAQTPIDIEDLKSHTTYAGGYSSEHPVICAFWKVVEGFNERQRRQLLKFVTSCSRAPLLGFKELSPAFCIQNAGREDRLPTASTCMNLLKLPEFESEEVLKVKLSYAVESGAGFELS